MSDKAISGTDSRENDRLLDDLLRCLESDWHISASWDGLRKFWCIELTEEGVRMRDIEQAIVATLGGGTCKNRDADIYPGGMVFVCSECEGMSTDGQPSYCPNCGRKVVE